MCEDRLLQGQEPHRTNLCTSPLDHSDHPLILAQSRAQKMLLSKWKEIDKEPCFLRTIGLYRGGKNNLSESIK